MSVTARFLTGASLILTNRLSYRLWLGVAHLGQIPIRVLNTEKASERKIHDDIMDAVNRIQSCAEDLRSTKVTVDHEKVQRQLRSEEDRLDEMVFKLYGLTDEEIDLVTGIEEVDAAAAANSKVVTNKVKKAG